MKTLKREEIYARDYVDLDHLRTNIQAFIEQYYNRCRLHSALGYKPPENHWWLQLFKGLPPLRNCDLTERSARFYTEGNLGRLVYAESDLHC